VVDDGRGQRTWVLVVETVFFVGLIPAFFFERNARVVFAQLPWAAWSVPPGLVTGGIAVLWLAVSVHFLYVYLAPRSPRVEVFPEGVVVHRRWRSVPLVLSWPEIAGYDDSSADLVKLQPTREWRRAAIVVKTTTETQRVALLAVLAKNSIRRAAAGAESR
jgi:hypothetical protein